MLFRLTALMPAAGEPLLAMRMHYGSPPIEVVVVPGPAHTAAVIATVDLDPAPRHLSVLDDLAADVLPRGSRPVEALSQETIQPGNALGGLLISIEYLPEPFRNYVDGLHNRLLDAATRCWSLLRWRYDVDVGRRGFASVAFEWSREAGLWHTMPFRGVTTARFLRGLPAEPEAAREVQRLATEGLREPVAFDLLREAEDLRQVNGRSALAIAMTALEVGVKEHIARTVPHARWLVEELPTPSVKKLLEGFVPTLPNPNPVESFPSSRLLKTIEKATTARNQLIHRGHETARAEFLLEVLQAIKDTLYILDALSGQVWALEHVSNQTRDELRLGASLRRGAQR